MTRREASTMIQDELDRAMGDWHWQGLTLEQRLLIVSQEAGKLSKSGLALVQSNWCISGPSGVEDFKKYYPEEWAELCAKVKKDAAQLTATAMRFLMVFEEGG